MRLKQRQKDITTRVRAAKLGQRALRKVLKVMVMSSLRNYYGKTCLGFTRITKRDLGTTVVHGANTTRIHGRRISSLERGTTGIKVLHWAAPPQEILLHWEMTQKNRDKESGGIRSSKGMIIGKIQKWEIARKDRNKERLRETCDRLRDMTPLLVPPWAPVSGDNMDKQEKHG